MPKNLELIKNIITSSEIKKLVNDYFFDNIEYSNENLETNYQKGLDIINEVCHGLLKSRKLVLKKDITYLVKVSFEEDCIRYQVLIRYLFSESYNVDCTLLIQKKSPIPVVDKKNSFVFVDVEAIKKIKFLPPANPIAKSQRIYGGLDPIKNGSFFTFEQARTQIEGRMERSKNNIITIDSLPVINDIFDYNPLEIKNKFKPKKKLIKDKLLVEPKRQKNDISTSITLGVKRIIKEVSRYYDKS